MRSNLSRFAVNFAAILALAFVAGSCSDNPKYVAPGKGNLALSFTAGASANGRTTEAAKPATVYVTVEDDNGNKKEFVRLKVLAFGEGYISESLELPVANYKLTMFHVLDDQRNVIYSSPREGSAMARFVNDPLDINFKIDEDAVTGINPEVLAVEENVDPGKFGYANFSFQKIDVTAFILPESDEKIVKVTYEFKNVFDTYNGEDVPDDNGVILLKDKLLNNQFQAQINVYTDKKDCSTPWTNSPYQKVYRLTTELTFTGAAIQLPGYDDIRWEPLYYRGNEEVGFLFSADPTKNYSIEIEVFNNDIHADNGWMDRYYYMNDGSTCNTSDNYATVVIDGERFAKLIMKDEPQCEKGLRSVDSYVVINTNKGPFREHFMWTIVNGKFVPGCDANLAPANNLKVQQERKAPEL